MAVFSRPLIAFIVAPWQLLLIRIGDRIGKGVRSASRDALIADSVRSFGNRGRAFGFHRAMDHLGAAIGPALATTFLYFWPDGMRTLIQQTCLPGFIIVSLLIFGLHEPPASAPPKRRLHPTLKPFDNNFRLFLLALVVFTLGNSSDAFLLVRAGELGVPTLLLPALWSVFHIAKSFSNVCLGQAVDRFRPRSFIFLGWFVYFLVYLGFGLATTAWHAWALFLCLCPLLRADRTCGEDAGCKSGRRRAQGVSLRLVQFRRRDRHAAVEPDLWSTLLRQFGAFVAFASGAVLALVAALMLVGVADRSPEKSV